MKENIVIGEVDSVEDDMISLYLDSLDRYLDLPMEIFNNSADLEIGQEVKISLKITDKHELKREIIENIGGFIKNPKRQQLI